MACAAWMDSLEIFLMCERAGGGASLAAVAKPTVGGCGVRVHAYSAEALLVGTALAFAISPFESERSASTVVYAVLIERVDGHAVMRL